MAHLRDSISNIFPLIHSSRSGSTIIITALATFAAIKVSRAVFRQKGIKIIRSPTATLLPKLSQAEKDTLPYPPDALPGGRDVDSPYGAIRVYEWGPEDGRKVLLVHGVTTSCLTLGAVAHGLVEKGCRVMLFDLWGRGYSDSPADLPHDDRLYATQILLAVTSSPLSWTGESGFSLLGYSLGGGISTAFSSHFQNLVNSLVLLAPIGIIREKRVAAQIRLFSIVNRFPKWIVVGFFRRKLRRSLFPAENETQPGSIEVLSEVAAAETEGKSKTMPKDSNTLASLKYPHVDEFQATQWGIQNNAGFFTSFLSTLTHFSATGHQESWKRLRSLRGKTLIIGGSMDPIVNAEDLKEDSMGLLGADKLEWRLIEGAHDFPATDSGKVVDEICSFWGI